MFVYRIEHANTKRGPFSQTSRARYFMENGRRPQDMPAESRDEHAWLTKRKQYISDSYLQEPRHAFTTWQQLCYWFQPQQRRLLHEDGFILRVYDLTKARYVPYKTQTIFDATTAVAIATFNLLELNGVPECAPRLSNIYNIGSVSL